MCLHPFMGANEAIIHNTVLANNISIFSVSRVRTHLLLSGSCLCHPDCLLSPPADLFGSDLLGGGAASPEEPRSELAQPRALLPWSPDNWRLVRI